MIDFLRRPAGRWTVRLLGLALGWVLATQAFGMAWDGDGHAFLVAMLLIVVVAIAYAIDQIIVLALSFVPPAGGAGGEPSFSGPIPPLSQAKLAQVRRMHKVLVTAGVFAPEVPDAELGFAHFAVSREPVSWLALLGAYETADRFDPQCDPSRWAENLAYDHIPQAWLTPPPGKVAAFLWEDDSHAFSLVEEASLPKLEKDEGGGPGWGRLTGEMLALFGQAKVFVR